MVSFWNNVPPLDPFLHSTAACICTANEYSTPHTTSSTATMTEAEDKAKAEKLAAAKKRVSGGS